MIEKEIRNGWRVYVGKIVNKVPNWLEVKYLEEFPNLVFVKDKFEFKRRSQL